MEMKAVYLKPLSSFSREQIHSDTLFGAICWGIRQTHGVDVLEEILEKFKEKEPPFLLSSAYPYLEKEEIHFFPKPINKPLRKKIESKEVLEKLKYLKKLSLLPEEIFNKYIGGEITDDDLFNGLKIIREKYRKTAEYEIDGNVYAPRGNTILKKEIKTPLFQSMDVQRNVINRLSGSTDLFHQSETFFPPDVSLYFLMKLVSGKNAISSALNFLQDRGIGGDISVGKGNFLVNDKDVDIVKEPADANSFTTLSLYCPTEDEIEYYKNRKEKIWYKMDRRKGKIESSFVDVKNVWKDTIQVLLEGSVFPTLDGKKFYGYNPIVKKKPFNVQQYGYAFPVKVKI